MPNTIIPYNSKLKVLARALRNNSTLSEVLLWRKIKGQALGVEFHRQVPINEFIVDFYCHEYQLAIEIDGDSHVNKYEYDRQRQTKLEGFGVNFIRFSDLDVKKNIDQVLSSLSIIIQTLNEQKNVD
jgi:very-short-patch-repair endonuclease